MLVVVCMKSSAATALELDSSKSCVGRPGARLIPDDVEPGLDEDEVIIGCISECPILGMITQVFGGDVQDCIATGIEFYCINVPKQGVIEASCVPCADVLEFAIH